MSLAMTPDIAVFVVLSCEGRVDTLTGSIGAYAVGHQADGQWVGFVAGRKISKIAVDGGAVLPLGDFTGIRGVSWREDGSMVIGPQKLLRIPAGGEAPETSQSRATAQSV